MESVSASPKKRFAFLTRAYTTPEIIYSSDGENWKRVAPDDEVATLAMLLTIAYEAGCADYAVAGDRSELLQRVATCGATWRVISSIDESNRAYGEIFARLPRGLKCSPSPFYLPAAGPKSAPTPVFEGPFS